jgi:hypothetical protein
MVVIGIKLTEDHLDCQTFSVSWDNNHRCKVRPSLMRVKPWAHSGYLAWTPYPWHQLQAVLEYSSQSQISGVIA